jgi:ribokinase
MIEVIGFGALNLDRLYIVDKILLNGEGPVTSLSLSPGGSAANTIFALAKLGVKTGFIGAVGGDEEGKHLVQNLAQIGVDTQYIKVKKGKTGEVVGLVDGKGHRALYVLPGANNLLLLEDIDLNYILQAKFLHLSSFVHDQQFLIQREVVNRLPHSVKISFAPGMLYAIKGLSSLSPLLKRTYILFINAQELKMLTGEGLVDGAKRCFEGGARLIVVTLGGGRWACLIYDGEREYKIPPRYKPKEVKDTTGAGDAFAAGFLFGLLKDMKIEECALLGEIMASFSLSQMGACSNLPTAEELWREYRSLALGFG